MATIQDVALKAKVSVATVSRVLNSDSVVADATRKRVLKAIKELNYTPNLLGRTLRRLETKKVLVLLNTISNQFYSRVVKGIEDCARSAEYAALICATRDDVEIERSYLELLKTHLCDGAIFLASSQSGEALQNELADLPTVQACEPKQGFESPIVSIDNEAAAYQAVSYLIQCGHRKIAFFGGQIGYDSSVMRERGYRRALCDNNIEIDEGLIFSEGFSFNSGIRAAEKLIKVAVPSAVFCVSDTSAAGAIKTLASHGISTPESISVMGFDDTQLSQIYIPSITTMRQPQYDIGYTAMKLLLGKINGEAENKTVILPHEIVKRESVAEATAHK